MRRRAVLWGLVLFVLAGLIGLYAQSYYLSQEHQKAALTLEQLGGKVTVKRRFTLGLPVHRFTVANLAESRVKDSELVHLKGLVNLSALVLDNTDITDAGLAHLKELSHLETVYLRKTRVSDAGVTGLQQALPHAKIER